MAGEEMPPCPRCAGAGVEKDSTVGEMQRSRCHAGHRTCIPRTGTPFAGHRWLRAVVVATVRWYRRNRLSAADVRDQLAERGVDVSTRTVLRWVRQFAPLLAWERAGGATTRLYRAIDEVGPHPPDVQRGKPCASRTSAGSSVAPGCCRSAPRPSCHGCCARAPPHHTPVTWVALREGGAGDCDATPWSGAAWPGRRHRRPLGDEATQMPDSTRQEAP